MRMSELTKSESPYLKHGDLSEMFGCEPLEIDVTVTCEMTTLDKYPDGKPAYCMKFAGIAKPLGLNKTNLRVLEKLHPGIESFPSPEWTGTRFQLYCIDTEMGPGLRLKAPRDTVQAESEKAKERIEAAQRRQGLQPNRQEVFPQEPENFVAADDPGPAAGQGAYDTTTADLDDLGF